MSKKNNLFIILPLVLIFLIYFFLSIKNENYQYACGVPFTRINKSRLDTTEKLVFNSPFRWHKNTLKVYFMDISNITLIDKTLKTANNWSRSANIRFKLTTEIFESDIRVSFREGKGYLSAIGNSATDSNYIGKSTLWLQNLDFRSDEEFHRVVLHEFGHAIALEHELQNPNANVPWDTFAVYNYYDTAYHWSRKMVDDFIFAKINTGQFTAFDANSIMIYAVPEFLTKNHVSIDWPQGLSVIDKKNIKKYYPF